ncbi:MAG: type II toxin-antitoxin system Phd/YefM family antitoxin [Hyphomonadaceae bacterium]
MKALTAVEAKVRFGAVLDAVERGEEIVVTRNGKVVARIVPANEPGMSQVEAVERLKTFAEGITLGGLDLRAMRDEGRR